MRTETLKRWFAVALVIAAVLATALGWSGLSLSDLLARSRKDACQCGMMNSMELARKRLQELGAELGIHGGRAACAHQLGQVARYGDVRQFDPAPLLPLIEELFVQGTLAPLPASGCDNAAAVGMLVAIDEMNKVSLEYHDRVEEPMWIERLQKLSDLDDRNPLLSGYAVPSCWSEA